MIWSLMNDNIVEFDYELWSLKKDNIVEFDYELWSLMNDNIVEFKVFKRFLKFNMHKFKVY